MRCPGPPCSVKKYRGSRCNIEEIKNVPKKLLEAAVAIEGISRLADPRSGGRTEKPRRRDAFAGKKFELLLGAQRTHGAGNLGKENGSPFEDRDGRIDWILAFLRRACLFWRWRIGKVTRLRLLLCRRRCGDAQQQCNQSQSRQAGPHHSILT